MFRRGAKEVASFARRIVHTLSLPKNACKPGWKDDSVTTLLVKLDEEFKELEIEMQNLLWVNGKTTAREITQFKKRIAEEATDLGAVCMMICDKVGGLDEREDDVSDL